MEFFRYSDNARHMQASEIRELMKLASRPGIIALGGGSPDGKSFPVAEVAGILKGLTDAETRAAFQYGTTGGYPPLLEQLRKRMAGQGLSLAGQQVQITTGAQQGLYLTAKALLNPGDTVLLESPSFIGAVAAFKSLRADLAWAPLQNDGMDVSAAEAILKKLSAEGRLPKFIYTIPNFQNPAGLTMSQAKRKALLALALHYNVPILEDDPYGELYFEGMAADYAPIKKLPGAESCVLYLNTFSKILSPGMRLGWITGPEALVAQLEIAKQSVDACSSSYTQVIAERYLAKGFVQGYVEKMRDIYRSKCNLMLLALKKHLPPQASWSVPQGGFFVWVTLPEGISARTLFDRALKRNVAFVTGAPFCEAGKGDHYARLAFSNASFDDIEKGVQIIGQEMKGMLP
ncbi:MAG: PLP-dependent aminotransferase family protein [Fibrobacterota bacterium]